MIIIEGYSDDLIEVAYVQSGNEDEFDSYGKDTLLLFDDGTQLRMHYDGAWKAIVEVEGKAPYTVTQIIDNGDYYTDKFIILTDKIVKRWKESA